jgi:hypothetical protein
MGQIRAARLHGRSGAQRGRCRYFHQRTGRRKWSGIPSSFTQQVGNRAIVARLAERNAGPHMQETAIRLRRHHTLKPSVDGSQHQSDLGLTRNKNR